jgi:hypothetical protein
MSERDLSTILREHLDDEPPVGVTSGDAIRTGRRQGRLRVGLVGGAAAAVLAVAGVTVPGLVGDDDSGTGREVASAPPAAVPRPELLESLAAARLAPLVGELGQPTWDVTDVNGEPRDPADEEAQYFQLSYHPAGTAEVHLRVAGFADADGALFLNPACPTAEEEGTVSSCTDETLDDGTIVTTAVGPHTRVTNTGSQLLTVDDALAHPDRVLWSQSVTVTTPDGVISAASEYVEAASPDAAAWLVPADVLRKIATDPDLLDPAAVAHAPFG